MAISESHYGFINIHVSMPLKSGQVLFSWLNLHKFYWRLKYLSLAQKYSITNQCKLKINYLPLVSLTFKKLWSHCTVAHIQWQSTWLLSIPTSQTFLTKQNDINLRTGHVPSLTIGGHSLCKEVVCSRFNRRLIFPPMFALWANGLETIFCDLRHKGDSQDTVFLRN